MKRYSKTMRYSLLMTGFMVLAMDVANAVPCPTITRDQLRTLCRHPFLKNIFKGGAGTVQFPDGATLKNDRKSCYELTSIIEKAVKTAEAKYPGKAFKDEKGIICTYDLDGKIYIFGTDQVDLPPPPEAKKENVAPPKSEPAKKVIQGWGYGEGATVDQGLKDIIIKPSTPAATPSPAANPSPAPQVAPRRAYNPPAPPAPLAAPSGRPATTPTTADLLKNPPDEAPPSRPVPRRLGPPVPPRAAAPTVVPAKAPEDAAMAEVQEAPPSRPAPKRAPPTPPRAETPTAPSVARRVGPPVAPRQAAPSPTSQDKVLTEQLKRRKAWEENLGSATTD